MNLSITGVLFAFCFLQVGNDVFDILTTGFVCNHDTIGCFNYDQVFYAD